MVEAQMIYHIGMGHPDEQAGGLNRYLKGLQAALYSAGASQALVISNSDKHSGGYVTVATEGQGLLTRSWRFSEYLRVNARPGDGVHVHFAVYAFVFMLLHPRRRRQLSVVMQFQGPWAKESASAGQGPIACKVKYLIERFVYRRADAFLVLTDDFAAELRDNFGVPSSKITKIRPGVDRETFAPVGRSDARERLRLSEKGRVVVTARRLVPRMGIADLITALAHPDLDDVYLLVVGDGSERKHLTALARERLPGRHAFLGRVSDRKLVDAYAAADASVVPTLELEGFGLVAIESMASGTPAVARPQGGLVDALAAFDKGSLLASDMSVEALRRTLSYVLGRGFTAAECVAYATAFSWTQNAEQVRNLHRAVAVARQSSLAVG